MSDQPSDGSATTSSPVNRWGKSIGNILYFLGWLFVAPLVIICVVFPPLWIPAGILFAVVWYLLSKAKQNERRMIVKLIGGCVLMTCIFLYWKFSTIVGYDNTLTEWNVNTYGSNNWGWNNDDKKNTEYVEKAVVRLGKSAYGMKFGQLMDSEKNYLNKQYIAVHPTPKSTPEVVLTIEPSEASTSSDSDAFFAEGYTAIISSTIDCFDSPEAMNEFIKTISDKDNYGMLQVLSSSSIQLVDGVQVRNIGNSGFLGNTVHLRIESGKHMGESCYLPSDQKVFSHIKKDD